MTDIYVEHARIETAAGHLKTHKATFDEILSQLESDLAPMISSWSGEARNLYLAKKSAWDHAAGDLTALLASIATLTENAHAAYVGAVTEVGAAWA